MPSYSFLYIRVFKQVGWQSAKIPFGAHIGTRAKQYPHILLLADADELGDVPVPGFKIKAAFFLFVVIPEDIGGDGIAAHGPGHLYAMPPVFAGNTGRVHFTADELDGFPVEQEIVF